MNQFWSEFKTSDGIRIVIDMTQVAMFADLQGGLVKATLRGGNTVVLQSTFDGFDKAIVEARSQHKK